MTPAGPSAGAASAPRTVGVLPGFQRAGRKVVKADELQQVLAAHDVLEQARQEAAQLREQVQVVHAEARRQGMEAGRAAALQGTLAELNRQTAALARAWQHDRPTLARWVVQAVEHVLHGHVTPGQRYEALLEAALQAMDDVAMLSIHVPPPDVAQVRAGLQAAAARIEGLDRVRVVADTAVRAGSCILQTPTGYLDVGLSAQLESLRRLVEQAPESTDAREADHG
jgi:type III secretion protein L